MHPLEIERGVRQLELRQPATGFEARNARRLLDERPAVYGTRAQELPDAALLDDRVVIGAEARAEEQVLHVPQPHHLAVEDVLALAVAEQFARDRDFAALLARGKIGYEALLAVSRPPLQ